MRNKNKKTGQVGKQIQNKSRKISNQRSFKNLPTEIIVTILLPFLDLQDNLQQHKITRQQTR